MGRNHEQTGERSWLTVRELTHELQRTALDGYMRPDPRSAKPLVTRDKAMETQTSAGLTGSKSPDIQSSRSLQADLQDLSGVCADRTIRSRRDSISQENAAAPSHRTGTPRTLTLGPFNEDERDDTLPERENGGRCGPPPRRNVIMLTGNSTTFSISRAAMEEARPTVVRKTLRLHVPGSASKRRSRRAKLMRHMAGLAAGLTAATTAPSRAAVRNKVTAPAPAVHPPAADTKEEDVLMLGQGIQGGSKLKPPKKSREAIQVNPKRPMENRPRVQYTSSTNSGFAFADPLPEGVPSLPAGTTGGPSCLPDPFLQRVAEIDRLQNLTILWEQKQAKRRARREEARAAAEDRKQSGTGGNGDGAVAENNLVMEGSAAGIADGTSDDRVEMNSPTTLELPDGCATVVAESQVEAKYEDYDISLVQQPDEEVVEANPNVPLVAPSAERGGKNDGETSSSIERTILSEYRANLLKSNAQAVPARCPCEVDDGLKPLKKRNKSQRKTGGSLQKARRKIDRSATLLATTGFEITPMQNVEKTGFKNCIESDAVLPEVSFVLSVGAENPEIYGGGMQDDVYPMPPERPPRARTPRRRDKTSNISPIPPPPQPEPCAVERDDADPVVVVAENTSTDSPPSVHPHLETKAKFKRRHHHHHHHRIRIRHPDRHVESSTSCDGIDEKGRLSHTTSHKEKLTSPSSPPPPTSPPPASNTDRRQLKTIPAPEGIHLTVEDSKESKRKSGGGGSKSKLREGRKKEGGSVGHRDKGSGSGAGRNRSKQSHRVVLVEVNLVRGREGGGSGETSPEIATVMHKLKGRLRKTKGKGKKRIVAVS
ncbi:hypothetical protein HK104_003250, partial [Borealophlyctis nickersoniae]